MAPLKNLVDVESEFRNQLATCSTPSYKDRNDSMEMISDRLQCVNISKSESSDENINNYFGRPGVSGEAEEEVFFSYSEGESDSEIDDNMEFDPVSAAQFKIPKLKEELRMKMWNKLTEGNCLHPYPESCINRIPNFIENEVAARIFSRTWQFRNAKFIKVNPSLAQKPIRENSLKYNKTLLVPASSLSPTDTHGGGKFYYKIDGEQFTDANSSGMTRMHQIRLACSRSGCSQAGEPLTSNWNDIKIDVFVVGSVLVAANGMRVGNSNNFTELEWAILTDLRVVDPNNTIVVTTVHEEQIVYEDDLPVSLLEPHDLPVDLIITPKRIINVREKLPKPSQGVLWDTITPEMMQAIPFLKELKTMKNQMRENFNYVLA